MDFGLMIVPKDSLESTLETAVAAERSGFRYVWVTDHFVNRNLIVVLTLMGLRTKKVTFGPGVTNPYVTHPAMIAQALSTIRELAGDRVVCGISVGDERSLGRLGISRTRPLVALRDAVQIIRDASSKTSFDYKGRAFGASALRIAFKVGSPLPIYLGAQGPKMLHLAGEIADGVIINFCSHPKDLERALSYVKQGAEASGRRLGDLHTAAYVNIAVSEDRDEAIKAITPSVAFAAAESSPEALQRHGIDFDKARKIRSLLMNDRKEEAWSLVTPQMIAAFSVAGTPEECCDGLRQLTRFPISQIVLGIPAGPGGPQHVESLSGKIISRL